MGLRFGSEEHLECITAIRADAFDGQPTCLGYKFTVTWVGVPWSVHDDGYVLTTQAGKTYRPLSPDTIEALQAEGALATPLPAYEIPTGWKVASYSGWGVIAIVVLVAVWNYLRGRRLARERATTPIATAGPVLERAGDREIDAAVRPHLAPGESISHQALAYDREPDTIAASLSGHRYLVALTDRRLILVTSKIGMFGRFKGKTSVTAIDRSDVFGVTPDDTRLLIRHAGGMMQLLLPLAPGKVSTANQRTFLLDLPRLFCEPELPKAVARPVGG